MMSECIANLKTLSKKFDIRIMGYPAIRGLDNEDWKDYFDLGIELYTPFWIDYNMQDVKNFNASFRHKFLTEPNENSFAWEGYDLTYYFLSGLALYGKNLSPTLIYIILTSCRPPFVLREKRRKRF